MGKGYAGTLYTISAIFLVHLTLFQNNRQEKENVLE